MIGSWLAIPMWVLYNLPNYRGGLGPHKLMLKQQAWAKAREEKRKAAEEGSKE